MCALFKSCIYSKHYSILDWMYLYYMFILYVCNLTAQNNINLFELLVAQNWSCELIFVGAYAANYTDWIVLRATGIRYMILPLESFPHISSSAYQKLLAPLVPYSIPAPLSLLPGRDLQIILHPKDAQIRAKSKKKHNIKYTQA